MTKINDAVVLVTGANRGLGRALVLASLEGGARRVYAGARDPGSLDSLVAQGQGRVAPLALDITDPGSLEAAARQATDVTVLINNAGVFNAMSVLTSTPAQLERDFATNVFGTLAATRAFAPALVRAPGGGALVNVLSVASLASVPALGGYSASKAAAHSVTQALRAELGKQGVSVHGVFAGPIDTDMVRSMDMPKHRPEDVARAILDGVSQGVEDIAPDPTSRQLLALWTTSPRELARQMASW